LEFLNFIYENSRFSFSNFGETVPWLKKSFDGLEPSMYLKNLNTTTEAFSEKFCIMNKVKTNMKIPLLELDPKGISQIILEDSELEPDARLKPLHATMRGMGGGKTRTLEEIRRCLFQQKSVFPIAITFNSHWIPGYNGVGNVIHDKCFGVDDPIFFYELAIVSRMASMFFEKDLGEIQSRLRSQLHLLSRPIDLIESMVVFMINRLSNYRRVDYFILLIDEAVAMQTYIRKHFNYFDDITSTVRQALLNNEIWIKYDNEAKRLNVALVISSLEISPIGQTSSNRIVRPIILPSKLNVNDIVKKIWKLKDDRFALVAATLNELPRLVQFAYDFISKKGNINFEREDISALYDYVFFQTRGMYGTRDMQLPSRSLLLKLIYGERVDIVETTDAIICSVVTNSLGSFTDKSQISPEVSLTMLYLASENDLPLLHEGLRMIYDTVKVNPNDIGHVMETAFLQWLKIRLSVVVAAESENLTLKKLMGLQSLDLIPPRFDDIFEEGYKLKRNIKSIELQTSSRKNITKFIDDLKAVQISEFNPMRIFLPAPIEGREDSFDVGLKVFAPDNDPLYLFFELKSKNEPFQKKTKYTITMEVNMYT
jgi:hypothetical protein